MVRQEASNFSCSSGGEMQLDDVRDAVATHDRRDARIDIVLTVLTVQQDRDRKDAVLVVEDGADDLRRRRADTELGAALAAQDGPAALAARIGEASRSSFRTCPGTRRATG